MRIATSTIYTNQSSSDRQPRGAVPAARPGTFDRQVVERAIRRSDGHRARSGRANDNAVNDADRREPHGARQRTDDGGRRAVEPDERHAKRARLAVQGASDTLTASQRSRCRNASRPASTRSDRVREHAVWRQIRLFGGTNVATTQPLGANRGKPDHERHVARQRRAANADAAERATIDDRRHAAASVQLQCARWFARRVSDVDQVCATRSQRAPSSTRASSA